MEALLEALQRKEFPTSQITALCMLSSLSGHSIASNKTYMESWLLKIAGFDQPHNALMRGDEMKADETELAEMVVFLIFTCPFYEFHFSHHDKNVLRV